MEKEPLPPAYNEVFPNNPTAPPLEQNFTNSGPIGWSNPHQQQPPQYAYQHYPLPPTPQQHMNQQPIVHQPLIQPQMMAQSAQVIVVNQSMRFGENPVSMICPHCREQTISKVTYESNLINHIMALTCCMFGFWCGCCLIPYCINSIKNVKHECNRCGTFLGIHRNGCFSA